MPHLISILLELAILSAFAASQFGVAGTSILSYQAPSFLGSPLLVATSPSKEVERLYPREL